MNMLGHFHCKCKDSHIVFCEKHLYGAPQISQMEKKNAIVLLLMREVFVIFAFKCNICRILERTNFVLDLSL